MGQYHLIVNETKRQYLHPRFFNDGAKLMEFGNSGGATLLALTVLLAQDNGGGGGDFGSRREPDPSLAELVGSWAGDAIVIAGDYGDDDDSGLNLWQRAVGTDAYQNVSGMMIELLLQGGETVDFDPLDIAREDGEPSRADRCVKLYRAFPPREQLVDHKAQAWKVTT